MDPICNHYQLSYYHDAYNRDHDEMFHTQDQNLSNGRMLKISKSEIGTELPERGILEKYMEARESGPTK